MGRSGDGGEVGVEEVQRIRLSARLAELLTSGFYDADEAMDALEDDLLDAGAREADAEGLRAEAQAAEKVRRATEATWPHMTANDRLEAAFDELNGLGIVALHNAGYTLSDGWSDVAEVAAERSDVRGAVFYHGQDVERGVRGEGLMLAFGVLGPHDPVATGRIGQTVAEVLRAHGLTVTWNGQVESRLAIAPFEWRKRRFTRRSGYAVLLYACDMERRIQVIKVCLEVLGLELSTARAGLAGLKPRTHRWDRSPPWVVLRGLPRVQADAYAKALTAAGAEVDVQLNSPRAM